MTMATARTLKKGDKLTVRGEVRKIDETGKWVEVQFTGYSLDIPVKDIRLTKRKAA